MVDSHTFGSYFQWRGGCCVWWWQRVVLLTLVSKQGDWKEAEWGGPRHVRVRRGWLLKWATCLRCSYFQVQHTVIIIKEENWWWISREGEEVEGRGSGCKQDWKRLPLNYSIILSVQKIFLPLLPVGIWDLPVEDPNEEISSDLWIIGEVQRHNIERWLLQLEQAALPNKDSSIRQISLTCFISLTLLVSIWRKLFLCLMAVVPVPTLWGIFFPQQR